MVSLMCWYRILSRRLLPYAIIVTVIAGIASVMISLYPLHGNADKYCISNTIKQHRYSVTIAVYYYVWYGGGLGGRHWNDSGLTIVVDKPLIGYYSSLEDSVIEWQLKLIRDAGIDVLFVSWWGPGSFEDKAARKVFSLLGKYGLKAAIIVEPYKPYSLLKISKVYGRKFWDEVLDYLYKNYILPYNDVYFHLDGKPLILSFSPVGLIYRPNDDRFTIRVVGSWVDYLNLLSFIGVHVDWDLWPDYLAPWTSGDKNVELRIRRDGYVAITPRFDDTRMCRAGARVLCWMRTFDPDYTLKAYIKQWEWILKNKDRINIVAIYSWNEYHERSEIEPHIDATKPKWLDYDPYTITREYIERIKCSG